MCEANVKLQTYSAGQIMRRYNPVSWHVLARQRRCLSVNGLCHFKSRIIKPGIFTPRIIKPGIFSLSLFLLPFFSGPLFAHEFWIEPESFRLETKAELVASTHVGQKFKGDSRPFVADYYRQMLLVNAASKDVDTALASAVSITGRLGDLPALRLSDMTEGLNIVALHTTDSELRRNTLADFEKFLQEEGLLWALQRHQARGLPEIGFVEKYTRFAKALVAVGAGQGSDHQVGFRFEWVALDNPYELTPQDSVRLQLTLDQQPVPNKRVTVFSKPSLVEEGENVVASRRYITTDSDGVILLDNTYHGKILINAVHLSEVDEAAASGALWLGAADSATNASSPEVEKTLWHSLWSSMVFERSSR